MSGKGADPIRDTSRRKVLLAAAALTPAVGAVGTGAAMAQAGSQRGRGLSGPYRKVAVVTGASRGIGAATARRLARDGYAVTVNFAGKAEPDGEVRFVGVIPNRCESVSKLMKKLGTAQQLRVCYEAGPTPRSSRAG